MKKVKIKCSFCDGTGGFNHSCHYCEGFGCMKLGWVEFAFWSLAKYLRRLIQRYGD